MALAQSLSRVKAVSMRADVYREIVDLNAESAEADMRAATQDEMLNTRARSSSSRCGEGRPKLPNVHFGWATFCGNR